MKKIILVWILFLFIISGCALIKQKTGYLRGVEFTVQNEKGSQQFLVTAEDWGKQREILDADKLRTNVKNQDEIIYTDIETQKKNCESDKERVTCNEEDYKRVCDNVTDSLEMCKTFEAFQIDCNETKTGWESCIFFPIESYEENLAQYMQSNNLTGEITQKKIAYYPLYG